MIRDPGNHLKDYARKMFPGEDASRMRIVEIGAAAHVDMAVPSVQEGLVVQLLLPHTAPVEGEPLITYIWFHGVEVWHYHKDRTAQELGATVFLYRDKVEGYVLLYLVPDEKRTKRLDHVVGLAEVLDPDMSPSAIDRLMRRERLARVLGYTVYLTGSQAEQIKRYRQAQKAKANKK